MTRDQSNAKRGPSSHERVIGTQLYFDEPIHCDDLCAKTQRRSVFLARHSISTPRRHHVDFHACLTHVFIER
jgi:hypothetical protein